MSELDKLIKDSRHAYKDINPNLEDCSETRWRAKKVIEEETLYDTQSLHGVVLKGIGTLEVVNRGYIKEKCLMLTTNTDVEYLKPRPSSSIHIKINQADWRQYNRISIWVYPESIGFQNFYFHFAINNKNSKSQIHAPSLIPNQWNHVVWEITYIERDCVENLSITPFLMGCPPEAEPTIKVLIDDILIQKVNADYGEGWNLDERIAYCHSGYYVDSKKVALTQIVDNDEFEICDHLGKTIYIGKPECVKTELGDFYQLDFTTVTDKGNYYLKIDHRQTPVFIIDDAPYNTAVWKSINFLRSLRCGDDVQNVHSPCHLNSYTTHFDERMVPNFGGWHDAGDVSQFEICTAEIAHALVDLAQNLSAKDPILSERLLEEARWGLNWLLRTRFHDGFRALSVHYSIWRKNVVKDGESFDPAYMTNKDIAENGPFENLLACAAEAAAARVFKELDPIFADWCLRSAVEDFQFAEEGIEAGVYTKRWGVTPSSQLAGAGALACAELYTVTNDEAYLIKGDEFASTILACQEKEFFDWKIPMRGFFYEDIAHTKLLTFEHRGHEQSPIHGLSRLCEVNLNKINVEKYKQGLILYAEYIKATCDLINPYQLLSAHVYEFDKFNLERITVPKGWMTPEEVLNSCKRQIEQGIELNQGVYLRRFPIAIQRRGFHATLLSKVKAVSIIAKALNDKELLQVAYNQLEWIFGKNPFASSSMYGEGHNYHPLYVAFSRQIVGSLPVGFKTLNDNDAPYWPTVNDAVYKEVWGHTTGKFLWVLSDFE